MSSSSRSAIRADDAIRGLLLGVLAGIVVAFNDFGALWLWLSHWEDRGALLIRTLTTLVPVGALLTAMLFVLAAWIDRSEKWNAPHRWPLPFLLVCAIPAFGVGHLLFTGGKMSRLPMRPLLEVLAGSVLLAAVYVGIRVFRFVFLKSRGKSANANTGLALLALGLSFLVGKVNQWLLPNLYDYLHALLTVKSFVLAACAVGFASRTWPALRQAVPENPLAQGAIFIATLLVLVGNMLTLDSNPNVRVAMFDPRAASTRSVMLGIEPMTSLAAAPRRAQRRHGVPSNDPIRARIAALNNLPVTRNANILMVSIDALRADHLGAYGYRRGVSPYLDELARHAVVFEHAYSAAPHSSYSLSSTMASEYLHETLDLGHELPPDTLPIVLAEAGYHTAGFYTLGIFHTEGERLGPYRDNAFGFQVHDHAERDAESTTTRVLEEVDRLAAHNETPAFLWAHYFDCHEPYEDTSLGTDAMDRYDGELRKTDRAVQRLVEETRRRLPGEWVFVITSDHGEEFHDHGGVYHGSTLYEEQIRVPLIVQASALPATRVSAPTQSIDLAPTLLGLVGVQPAESMRGHDLRGVATHQMDSVGPAFAAVLQKRMIVDWPYKLIADLRFSTYAMFNLERDPQERQNLASADAARMTALRGRIYEWLDDVAIPLGQQEAVDPRDVALQRGRLTDRRAVPALGELLLDRTATVAMRREAAQILTRLADESSAAALIRAMDEPEPLVAAEAAIALGRMYNPRAREKLRELVLGEDPDIRTRAGISLGRLRDTDAVPALIEAIGRAETAYDREEAVRWLGRLHDPRGVESLLALIPEFRTRHLVAIALGEIGDPRAYDPLVDMLSWEHHLNVRDAVVRGLGRLGDPRILPQLVHIAATEHDVSNTPESLVRLGAIERGFIGGADITRESPGLNGFGRCVVGPLIHDWDYAQRTFCESNSADVSVPLRVSDTVRSADEVVLLINVRRSDTTASATLEARVGNDMLAPIQIDGQWSDRRWSLTREQIGNLTNGARFTLRATTQEARIWLDHVLLAPVVAHAAN